MKTNNFAKEKKLHQKHKYRNNVFKIWLGFIAVFGMILYLPNIVGRVKAQPETTRQITDNSRITKVNYYYNPIQQKVLGEFYIGDMSNLSSFDDDQYLSNIKYLTQAIDNNGNVIKVKGSKINNHFFTVKISGVDPKKFNQLSVRVLPQKINTKLDMGDFDGSKYAQFKIKSNNVIKTKNSVDKNGTELTDDYKEFLTEKYNELIKKREQSIVKANAELANDEKMVEQTKQKMAKASPDQKESLHDNMQDYKSDIDTQKQNIETYNSQISNYKQNIASIKQGIMD